jgi:hypothetical protein
MLNDSFQDIKLKKSFSGGSGSIGRSSMGSPDTFSKKKSSSNGIKHHKESKDKEKLNV